MYDYAIRFERDVAGVAVFCRDLPKLNSFGDNREHAISQAVDAIETTLSLYVEERLSIPQASIALEKEHVVRLPVVTVAKIELWNEMMKRDMRKADLCRLLGVHQAQGDRMVDFLHVSKMEQLEAALLALNVRVKITTEEAQNPMNIWIDLPESRAGTRFTVGQLVEQFQASGSRELVVGKSNGNLADVKGHSVDFILRSVFASDNKRNTRQATIPVVDAIVASGKFRRSRMVDPLTNKEVDSLALI